MEDQRKDCKYISQKCPNYSPDAYTCNHGGGDYCGKFRWYENRTTFRKTLSRAGHVIKRYFTPVYSLFGMALVVYAMYISQQDSILMYNVLLFGLLLTLFIQSISEWIR